MKQRVLAKPEFPDFDEFGRTAWEQRDPDGYLRYWQSRTPAERTDEVFRLIELKHGPNIPFQRVAVVYRRGEKPPGD